MSLVSPALAGRFFTALLIWEVLENPLYMAILRVSRSGHVFPRVKQVEAALVFLCQQGRMLHNQDWLHNLWGPAQNENVESLVKKLRI